MNKIRSTVIKKNVCLGRKFFILIPEKDSYRHTVERFQFISHISMFQLRSAKLDASLLQFFGMSGKCSRQRFQNPFLKSRSKRRSTSKITKRHPAASQSGIFLAVSKQGIYIQLCIVADKSVILHRLNFPCLFLNTKLSCEQIQRQIIPFILQFRQFLHQFFRIHL